MLCGLAGVGDHGLEVGSDLLVKGRSIGAVVVLAASKRTVQCFLCLRDATPDDSRFVERSGASHRSPFLSGGSPALVEMTPGGSERPAGWRSTSGGRSAVRSGRQAVPKGREERSAVSTAAL